DRPADRSSYSKTSPCTRCWRWWHRGQPSKAAEDGDRTERAVEEEPPAPTELLGQKSADERAECGSNVRDPEEGTNGQAPMITDDCIAGRRHTYGEQRRGAGALQSPKSDQ